MSEIKRETAFENAKVGDRVYSPLFKTMNPDSKTNGVINCIYSDDAQLEIKPDIVTRYYTLMRFSFDGSFTQGGGQILFWENPIKEIPVRPKRKVIKKGWMGLVPSPTASIGGCLAMTTCVYADSSDVPYMSNEKQRLIAVQFEVEE